MKKCQNCGTKNDDFAKQCNFCEALLPETKVNEIKKSNYVHNETAEKKKAKNSKIIAGVVISLVVCNLALLLTLVFSGNGESKNSKLVGMITDSVKSDSQLSGTLKGASIDIAFTASFKEDHVIVSLSGCEYDSMFISKDAMILERDRENDRKTLEVTKDMELYKLQTAYATLKNASESEKNVLDFDTSDIKNTFLPPIKNALGDDFDKTFIEENFVSAIGSVLMILDNDPDLEAFMGIKLKGDVENAEIPFDFSSYNLQNEALSKLKKSFKNQSDYDKINQTLKDAKSTVKSFYKANGSITTENGKIKSASAEIVYEGVKFQLTVETMQ